MLPEKQYANFLAFPELDRGIDHSNHHSIRQGHRTQPTKIHGNSDRAEKTKELTSAYLS